MLAWTRHRPFTDGLPKFSCEAWGQKVTHEASVTPVFTATRPAYDRRYYPQPGPQRTGSGFRHDIHGLRALAVVAVVLYHAQVPFFAGGYVGVDVFFVISGFLITTKLLESTAEHGRVNFVSFYGRRVRRLLPAAIVVLLTTVLVGRLFGPISSVKTLAHDAIASALSVMNYQLVHRNLDYLHSSENHSALMHYWSLSVEEQFYLLWPVVIALAAWVARRFSVSTEHAVRTALAIIFTTSLAASVLTTSTNPVLAYHSVHTRAWELAAGGLLAAWGPQLFRFGPVARLLTAWAGLVAITIAVLTYSSSTPFPGYTALLPVLATVAVIAANTGNPERSPAHVLGHQVAQFLGKHSYTWYLWHWPVIVLLPHIIGVHEPTWPLLLATTPLSLVMAVGTHYAVELPSGRSPMSAVAWLPTGAGFVTVVVVAGLLSAAIGPSLHTRGAPAVAAPLTASAQAKDSAEDKANSDATTEDVKDTPGDGRTGKEPPSPAQPDQVLADTISAALTQEALPANLQPGLADAADALPQPVTDGCHVDFRDVDHPECAYGTGTKKVVIFGDSHAGQWFPALHDMAARHDLTIYNWTKAGCGVADMALTSNALGRAYTECDQWRTDTLSRIASLHPDLVIASQSDDYPGDQVTDTAWAEATLRTVQGIADQNVPITFVLDTPVWPTPPADCLAKHPGTITKCTFSVDDITKRPARRQLVTARLAATDVHIVDPTNWVCRAGSCPAVIGQYLVFRDRDHLTSDYATYLTGVLEPIVTSRLSRPRQETVR